MSSIQEITFEFNFMEGTNDKYKNEKAVESNRGDR